MKHYGRAGKLLGRGGEGCFWERANRYNVRPERRARYALRRRCSPITTARSHIARGRATSSRAAVGRSRLSLTTASWIVVVHESTSRNTCSWFLFVTTRIRPPRLNAGKNELYPGHNAGNVFVRVGLQFMKIDFFRSVYILQSTRVHFCCCY